MSSTPSTHGGARGLWTGELDVDTLKEWLEPLVVSGGVVHGGAGSATGDHGSGAVSAVAADSGKPLRTEHTEREPELHGLLDGSALFSTKAGTLHAVDARTGASARTRLSTGDPAAAVGGDRVYFDGGDGRLRAGRISLTST